MEVRLMTKLIFVGSDRLLAIQKRQVEALLKLYELSAIPEQTPETEIWFGELGQDGEIFGCNHYELDIPGLFASAAMNEKLFLAEVAKVAGVYIDECPEHAKRRFWQQNEHELIAAHMRV
jgi:hypothetical protein